MPKDSNLRELSKEEDKIKLYWNDIIKHVRRDLAYIWSNEVRRDFWEIKKEVGKVAFILRELHRYYKTDKEKYYKEISDIRNLLRHLNKIEAKSKWVKQIRMDLEEVIRDVESEKVNIESIDKQVISRRGFLKFAGKVAAATAAALISPKIPFLLPSADAAERKKYLSYEELMKLVKKYDYVYHDSNIKPGQVPRIILFGEKHEFNLKKYRFLEEFYRLVDKQKKNLIVLFEGKGELDGFNYYYDDLHISDKAQYFGIDTYRSVKSDDKYFSNKFARELLNTSLNEGRRNPQLIEIWKNHTSAGYAILKIFNIDLTKDYSVTKLQEILLSKIKTIEKNIDEDNEQRDKTMMENTMHYVNKFPNYQFFLIVGGLHIDTHGDKIKENDRFSLFFNQNKISYFSIIEVGSMKLFGEFTKFDDLITDRDHSYFRKIFCRLNNCDEQLIFRLAKEK